MARILVTGVGAIIGYGILRNLRPYSHFLIGLDVFADAVGQCWCDEFVQAEYTNSPGYLAFFERVLESYSPDLVIPGIEQDVHAFDHMRELFAAHGAKVCLNRSDLIRLSQDKWLMHQAQLRHGIEPIPSSLTANFDLISKEFDLPFILKPRRSYAGKGIVIVPDRTTFRFYENRVGETLMAQKIVGSSEEEYTVGIFGDGQGALKAAIQFRRKLSQEGATQKAWRIDDKDLDDQVRRIVSFFRPLGPTNLQFRKMGGKYYLLEINPRIASATSLRAAFGFNDGQMAVNFYLSNKWPEQPELRSGFALRYIEDMVIYDRSHV